MPWVAVCNVDDIPPGRGWPVTVGEHRIAVFRTAGGLRAVDNRCSHVGNPIDDASVSGEVMTCPWHGWRYDLRTGDHLTVFGHRSGLRTYPVRSEGGQVLVEVE